MNDEIRRLGAQRRVKNALIVLRDKIMNDTLGEVWETAQAKDARIIKDKITEAKTRVYELNKK